MAAFQNANWYFLVILCVAALYAAAVSVAPKATAREGFLSVKGAQTSDAKGKSDGGSDDGSDDGGKAGGVAAAKKQHRAVCNVKSKNFYGPIGCKFLMKARDNLAGYELSKKDNNKGAQQMLEDFKQAMDADVLANTMDACFALMEVPEGSTVEDARKRAARIVEETDMFTKLSSQIDVALKALKSNPDAGGSKWM